LCPEVIDSSFGLLSRAVTLISLQGRNEKPGAETPGLFDEA
jgi:hypothetical protein